MNISLSKTVRLPSLSPALVVISLLLIALDGSAASATPAEAGAGEGPQGAMSAGVYDGIYVVEAVPGDGVRENCLSTFVEWTTAYSWWTGRPHGLRETRESAAGWAAAKIGARYALNTPKGPYGFTCVGLVEAAYEAFDVDLTSAADEDDGWFPDFFPDEQFASPLQTLRRVPGASEIEVGDIVYRDTWGSVDVIPGVQDHVGIVTRITRAGSAGTRPQAVEDACLGYDFTHAETEQCCCDDQVDNDQDGAIDWLDRDCGGPGLPWTPPETPETGKGCNPLPRRYADDGQLAFAGSQPLLAGRGVDIDLTMGHETGEARVAVHDVRGRFIRLVLQRRLGGDSAERVRWDGRDKDGRPLTPGVYVVRFTAPGVNRAGKLVVTR